VTGKEDSSLLPPPVSVAPIHATPSIVELMVDFFLYHFSRYFFFTHFFILALQTVGALINPVK
jgi:hypothetical protein